MEPQRGETGGNIAQGSLGMHEMAQAEESLAGYSVREAAVLRQGGVWEGTNRWLW